MIVLLDLNFTLVANSGVKVKPFAAQIDGEEYRHWLAKALQDAGHTVILLTARPERYRDHTLKSIKRKLGGWQPQHAYFNDLDLPPPALKEAVLVDRILPQFGEDAGQYLAIESNPATRAMFARHGIKAMTAAEYKAVFSGVQQ